MTPIHKPEDAQRVHPPAISVTGPTRADTNRRSDFLEVRRTGRFDGLFQSSEVVRQCSRWNRVSRVLSRGQSQDAGCARTDAFYSTRFHAVCKHAPLNYLNSIGSRCCPCIPGASSHESLITKSSHMQPEIVRRDFDASSGFLCRDCDIWTSRSFSLFSCVFQLPLSGGVKRQSHISDLSLSRPNSRLEGQGSVEIHEDRW